MRIPRDKAEEWTAAKGWLHVTDTIKSTETLMFEWKWGGNEGREKRHESRTKYDEEDEEDEDDDSEKYAE